MKRLFFSLIISCACFIVASCSKEAAIGGTANKAKNISVYTFDRGNIELLCNMPVNRETGRFDTIVSLPYHGLYLLKANGNAMYPVHLKNGENIELEFNNNQFDISGNGISEENQLLFEWENNISDVKTGSFLHTYLPGGHSLPYPEFFAQLQKAEKTKSSLLEKIEGENGDFYIFLRDKLNADLDFYALNYLRAEGYSIPDTVALPSYYSNINPDNVFQNERIVNLPYAGKMLDTYVWYKNRKTILPKGEVRYFVETLESKTLQQEYLITAAEGMKSYDELLNMLEQVGENFFTTEYQPRLSKVKENLLWSKPGVQAPDFTAMAPDSTWMKLSDYKGKVVVADVWATWCEPCRRLMPLFHELQKEFVSDNVVFLSICVGVSIEVDKWLELSKEFHIEKNNFFVSGWNSDFVKDYRISGVPRYMIFDEQGRIVSVVAPNPTTSRLKDMIKKQLD